MRLCHRDVKSENALLTAKESSAILKLGDFGLCKDVAEALRGRDRFWGTPNYMPAQCVRQEQPMSARADLFALGCVIFEMVERQLLFEQDADTSEAASPSRGGVWSRYDNLREAHRLCVWGPENLSVERVKALLSQGGPSIEGAAAAGPSGAARERSARRPDADAATTHEANQLRRQRRAKAKAKAKAGPPEQPVKGSGRGDGKGDGRGGGKGDGRGGGKGDGRGGGDQDRGISWHGDASRWHGGDTSQGWHGHASHSWHGTGDDTSHSWHGRWHQGWQSSAWW